MAEEVEEVGDNSAQEPWTRQVHGTYIQYIQCFVTVLEREVENIQSGACPDILDREHQHPRPNGLVNVSAVPSHIVSPAPTMMGQRK